MEKNELLKDLQEFFKTAKKDITFMKNELEFREALKVLDVDAIKSLIEKGFNISEFEQENGSTLIRAMYDSSDIMLSIFKKDLPKEYIQYYCEFFPQMGVETLPEPLKKELIAVNQSLIAVMDVLYNAGADINRCVVQVEDSSVIGVLMDKTNTLETSSPFEVAIGCLDYFKSSEVITWFLGKDGFDLNEEKNVASKLIRLDSTLSTEVLNILLLSGLKVGNYNVGSVDSRYSSLHECAVAGGVKTRNDKLQLLYQFATPEQRFQYNQDYEMIRATQNSEQVNHSK